MCHASVEGLFMRLGGRGVCASQRTARGSAGNSRVV